MYTSLNFEADDRPPGGSFWHQYNFAGSITMVFASGVASALDSLNCAVSGASSGRGEGRTTKDAPLARETVAQLDDFAGWVKAKRMELRLLQIRFLS